MRAEAAGAPPGQSSDTQLRHNRAGHSVHACSMRSRLPGIGKGPRQRPGTCPGSAGPSMAPTAPNTTRVARKTPELAHKVALPGSRARRALLLLHQTLDPRRTRMRAGRPGGQRQSSHLNTGPGWQVFPCTLSSGSPWRPASELALKHRARLAGLPVHAVVGLTLVAAHHVELARRERKVHRRHGRHVGPARQRDVAHLARRARNR